MKELYGKINDDIEEGLPLINDEIYSVPKYHFNKKAAHAFAARFNLYYHNYDNVIKYANVVLGATPHKMLKDWNKIVMETASNWDVRVDMYISASDPSNLLLLPVSSSWGYWGGPYSLGRRYGHAQAICLNESGRAAGMWGAYSNLLPFKNVAPLDVYNDKLYIELEKCFRKEFEELNTDASILFVSEKSLVRADNPIISFLPTIDVEKEIKLEFSFNCNSINNENYSNSYMGYAIAA